MNEAMLFFGESFGAFVMTNMMAVVLFFRRQKLFSIQEMEICLIPYLRKTMQKL